ncbi:uncharacterized protein BDR25DRAFT_308186 [Lindgomyces ingoldianus]|uniref:Uncharacterized protein n=1 Tax=Lindgomyces ingoldianus TaxID=673940 RepID=A0ACB6Q932_9PLEO|nr:uncharacterized protein BDR25DRAFT_308186 [Lindgomyces ingoldianus]KAF2462666.1 hypothetical protein BDR25DRAFT_308186 [Lindgomyces ingoldianus]
MTTRAASKAASNNTSPAAPSTIDGSSRRSSLNDLAQDDGGVSDTEERPAKRSRLSTDSGSPQEPFASQIPLNGSQTINDTKSTSRRGSTATKPASKKRRASSDSTESSKTVGARPNGPNAANGVFARNEKDMSEKQPRRKKRKTSATPPEPTEPPPELTDASTPPGSPEQPPDIESSQNVQTILPATNGEVPAKAAKRLPGRRRQPHANVVVETDLRRQLPLKMDYRALAKQQKVMLDELSRRSIQVLNNDSESYKNLPEYQETIAALNEHRDRRLDQLNAQRQNRLDAEERVCAGQEHNFKNQHINTFKTLQDNLMLHIYYDMKQLHREMKAHEGATDDEENIIEPTHTDFPALNGDDRLGSQYASRSRAYIETERMIAEEDSRGRLGGLVQSFMTSDEDLNDSIGKVPAGFAQFTGPPRDEAIALYNVASLAEAAEEIEKTPAPSEASAIILNEQADALFILASVSADRPQEPTHGEKQLSTVPPSQVVTPVPQTELQRQTSPFAPMSTASTAMSLETARSSPAKQSQAPETFTPTPLQQEPHVVQPGKESDTSKKETPVKVSTHRIMDILNDDQDIALPRSRESRASILDHTPSASPSRRPSASHSQHPSQNGSLRMEALYHSQEQSVSREMGTPSEASAGISQQRSPPPSSQFWSSKNLGSPKEHAPEALPDKNPLDRIKRMLDAKKQNMLEHHATDGYHGSQASQGSQGQQTQQGPPSRRGSLERPNMAPPFARAFNSYDRPESRGESRRPSAASPPTGHYSYNHSPHESHAAPYVPPSRHTSADQGSRQWNDGRRLSGPPTPHQPPPPAPYGAPPYQPYNPDYSRPGPTPPTHQSPYPPPNAHSMPPSSQPLPAKPPGPPAQVTYRFAHYDPAPPMITYPQASPPTYPTSSHPPPHAIPPPPPHYATPYNASHQYQGYVPPPGSFQAPPPPPPQPMSQYPPLKIHQYGGQRILPANMAPPLPQSPMSPYGPPPHAPAFSQQAGPPKPHYEHPPSASQERSIQESRPRRQYRSWHAPGTEFRSYQGPNQRGRRGG